MLNTIIIIFIIASLLILVFYHRNKIKKTSRINKQLKSIGLNLQLKKLLLTIQQQRGLCSRYKNGETSLVKDIVNNLKITETTIYNLEYQFSEFLNNDTRWMTIRNDWVNLRHNMLEIDEENSFTNHSLVIENIIFLIGSVAHKGQNDLQRSISDDEINVIWENIPQTLEAVGKTRAIGCAVATSGICSHANKIKLKALSNEITRNFNIISNQLNKNSPNEETIEVTIKISQVIDNFIEMVRGSLIVAKTPEINADPFFRQATDAMEGISQLFDKMSSIKAHQIERTLY